jgi:hypothetical protein
MKAEYQEGEEKMKEREKITIFMRYEVSLLCTD